MFEYKMVQIPPNIAVQMKAHKGNEAAAYLENVVNKYASEGWEFQRVDSIGVQVQPGCMDALSGKKAKIAVTTSSPSARRNNVSLAVYKIHSFLSGNRASEAA